MYGPEKIKNSYQTREGEKLNFTPLFITALIKAIKDFPLLNSSVDGDKIIQKKSINISMATALNDGSLIVPVIHNEERPGAVNFSVVGRNATIGERKMYVEHDTNNRERESIALQFNMMFGDTIMAKIGGDTGIDIYPVGWDKSQILSDFKTEDNLYFFGDKTLPGGNDEPLAKLIRKTHQVRDWRHTFETLQYFQESKLAA